MLLNRGPAYGYCPNVIGGRGRHVGSLCSTIYIDLGGSVVELNAEYYGLDNLIARTTGNPQFRKCPYGCFERKDQQREVMKGE